VPNEKITWGKLEASTPRFVIEVGSSIVAPLMLRFSGEVEATPTNRFELSAFFF